MPPPHDTITDRDRREAPPPRRTLMRRLVVGAVAAALPLAAITAFLGLHAHDDRMVDAVRDIGQLASALAAVVSCIVVAKRSLGQTRTAWGLLAASAGCAFVGELGEAAYTIWLGMEAPFPSAADVGFLVAIPLAIGGLLSFPGAADQFATRRRAVLDLAMVALSLTFISSALDLPVAELHPESRLLWWVGPALSVADIAIITVIFVSVRRSLTALGGRLVLVVSGLAIIALADSGHAFLSASGALPTLRLLFGAGSMYGYTAIALAPLWPERKAREQQEITMWQALLPYFGVAAVAVTGLLLWLLHRHISEYVAFPAAGLLVVLLASELLSHAEARTLLRQSRLAEARVRERETMLNDVIEHAPQGVASISVGRRIKNANPRLASMLFAPLPVLVGGTTDSFLPEDYVARIFKGLASTRGNPDAYEADCQARRADGSQFWIHLSVTPIRKADSSVDYFLATFEDVTAKREAEETAVANLAQLDKLNRLKSEFVSMVSHEFRTALVGIQGFSELIRDQDMNAAEAKILAEEINNDAQRLNRMITEMLDFDRLEAGKIHLELKPLDMNELVNASIERASVSSPDHVVTAELQQGLPSVLGDSDRLTQVLGNLLSNAIKYSPAGGEVCVRTRLNGAAVEVAVKDHGRGIPPEFISRLFGRYERYEDKHAGKIIGTGLGLAIARQIVEMHGGRISVDSALGSGSEFRFTVPLATTVSTVTR